MPDRTTAALRTTARRLAAIAVLVASGVATGDTVTLRPAVRVAADATVTLGDVATLDGAEARGLAGLRLGVADAGAFELAADRVRQAIVAAGGDPARIRVRGESVVVRPTRGRPVRGADGQAGAAPVREGPTTGALAVPTRPEPRLVDPAEVASTTTPLGLVASHLVGAFGADAADLRLSVRADDLVRLAGRPGLRHEVVPRSALRSDRADFEIVSLEPLATGGSRVVSRERIRIEPRLLRTVAVATCDARRGETLTDASLRIERLALAPSAAARAADDPVGATLARSVAEGSVIGADDLERSIAVRRNDRVTIRRELGAVAIEIEAIALEDGTTGDVIAFETTGGGRRRDARPVSAEIVARGRAVIR
jgi:flagella basal body P-ring formation protein FlgA